MAKRRREDPLLNQAECLGVHHDASEGAFLDRVATKYAQRIGALQIGEIGGRADRMGALEQSDGLLPHRDVLGKTQGRQQNQSSQHEGRFNPAHLRRIRSFAGRPLGDGRARADIIIAGSGGLGPIETY
jgi:hypothetical protein